MRVHQVMTEKVSFVDPNMRIPEIARRMRDEDIRSLPVRRWAWWSLVDEQRHAGRRLSPSPGQGARETTLRQIMSPKILYCSKTTASRTH